MRAPDDAEPSRSWLAQYDRRRLEAELGRRSRCRTIAGVEINFLHVRSPRADARPLLMTRGWPGSAMEFLDALDDLSDPPPGQPAFHVVAPSPSGPGFPGNPAEPGRGADRIADTWAELMSRLGYQRFLA